MKTKKLIITISIIAIIGSVTTLLIVNSGEKKDNKNPEVIGVSNTKDQTIQESKNPETISVIEKNNKQEKLWDTAIANFQSYNNRYSSLANIEGSVSRFGRKFNFNIQFEAFVDGENSDIRIYSGDKEFYIKSYNSNICLSENSDRTNWYELNLTEVSNTTGQNLSLGNLTDLANIGNDFEKLEQNYTGSLSCNNQVCQSFKVNINNQPAEIVINESSQSIQEVKLNNNGRKVSLTFVSSENIVNKPQNVTVLSSTESKERIESALSEVVRNSIF
jgi:gas vesicle protein